MRKITDLFKCLLLVIILVIMTNCSTTEINNDFTRQSASEAKLWYENHKDNYDAVILNYIQNVEWENALVSSDNVLEVPFTLKYNLKISNEKGTLHNGLNRLVFVKDSEQNFKIHYFQIFADDENSNSLDKKSSYYGVTDDFSGEIFKQDLKTNNVTSIKYVNGKNIQPSLTSKMREQAYNCTFFGEFSETGYFTPIKVVYCESIGDEDPTIGGGVTTGGGGGGGTGGNNTPKEDAPPSCHSFDFKSLPGANWQEALVKNIRFKIVLLSQSGAEIIHAVSYPQPISFGAPVINRYNTTYSAGLAADIAAKAVNESMKNVVDKYGRTTVSDLVLDQYFKERLAHNYNYYMDGGRVQFNSTSSQPATEYKTTFLWNDDCILD